MHRYASGCGGQLISSISFTLTGMTQSERLSQGPQCRDSGRDAGNCSVGRVPGQRAAVGMWARRGTDRGSLQDGRVTLPQPVLDAVGRAVPRRRPAGRPRGAGRRSRRQWGRLQTGRRRRTRRRKVATSDTPPQDGTGTRKRTRRARCRKGAQGRINRWSRGLRHFVSQIRQREDFLKGYGWNWRKSICKAIFTREGC